MDRLPKLTLDFHTLQLFSKPESKTVTGLKLSQFLDLLELLLLQLQLLDQQVMRAKRQLLMPKNQKISLMEEPTPLTLDSHTPLHSFKLKNKADTGLKYSLQSQHLSQLLLPPLETSTLKELKEKRQLLMPKNPKISLTEEPT
jgi:hypothetical protein